MPLFYHNKYKVILVVVSQKKKHTKSNTNRNIATIQKHNRVAIFRDLGVRVAKKKHIATPKEIQRLYKTDNQKNHNNVAIFRGLGGVWFLLGTCVLCWCCGCVVVFVGLVEGRVVAHYKTLALKTRLEPQ